VGRAMTGLGAGLTLAATCLLMWAPPALAEAPPNDNFAEAQPLTEPLPIEAPGSNAEATKETGESLGDPFAAGHSVWFEWEAPATEWITAGSCENPDFRTIVGVFTGTAVNALTKVASTNDEEGPHCRGEQSEYTFKAIENTIYMIAVDGNAFYLPPAEPPATEGEFTLRIESTPPPPNDDFANATMLEGKTTEEPGGARFYYASTAGYNWNATTEAGEPSYGTNSGASVWYRWTAPERAKYRFNGPCCGGGLNWRLYIGDSLDELSQVLEATGSAEVIVPAAATAWISVYGTPDLATEEPSMKSFSFSIAASLPPLPPAEEPPGSSEPPPSPPPDTIPPDTKIFKSVLKRRPPIFVFHFHSSEPGSTFRCKLDRHPLRVCPASKRFAHLKPGRHILKVFAVDAAGNKDPSPALARFSVPHTHKRHHHAKRAPGKR
jgi:hypothetical protein